MGVKRNLKPIFNPTYSLILNGDDGSYYFGALGRSINRSLTMKEFGDCVGVCLHYQDADEISNEIADNEIANGSKKKKD
jgi:hypothetical protein